MPEVQEFLDQIFWGNSIENYLWFVGIILVALVFKRLISKKLGQVIFKIFKRKEGDNALSVDQFFELMIKPVELLIVFVGLSFAAKMIHFPAGAEGEIDIERIADVLIQMCLVFSVTWGILRLIDFVGVVLMEKAATTDSTADDQIIQFVKEALRIFTYIFAFLFVLGAVFKLNIGAMVAGLGIGGLAIALAAQDTLQNVIASFIIFFDKPFVVGDYIKVQGISGVVEKIGFRSTRIRTLEKSFLTMPNNMLISNVLDNMSLRTFRRSKFQIGLLYGTTSEQIKGVVTDLQAYIDEHDMTNQDGLVRFEEFGDSSMNITVLLYVDTQSYDEYMRVIEDINFQVMEIVSKHGSDFAFPTTTVHLHKEN